MEDESKHKNLTSNEIFHSGGYLISPESGELVFGLKKIRISPNNMRVLKVLLVNSQQVVSRGEIFDTVWKNQVVSEDTLTRCVSDLRSALRSINENKKLIETIPKLGYRWLEPVSKNSIKSVDKEERMKSSENKLVNEPAISQPNRDVSRSFLWSVSILLLMIILVVLVWITNKTFDRQIVRVALMPFVSKNIALEKNVRAIDSRIRENLLATNKIRFLSSQASNSKRFDLYPYLAREYAIDWIIEGDISLEGNKSKITLNLVDARTALVEYSFSNISLLENSQQIEQAVDALVIDLKRSMLLE